MMGGIACLFSPGVTFFAAGYVVMILLFIYGIAGIVQVIRKKSHAIMLIPSILALIIGIICIFFPGNNEGFYGFMVFLFGAWFVIQGIITIVVSIQSRGGGKGWIAGLIIGIIAVLLGIYSLCNPLFSVIAIGILVAIYLIQAGLSLIVMSTAVAQEE